MNESSETSSDGTSSGGTSTDEGGEQCITVRRLVPTKGLTSRRIVRAVRKALNDRPVHNISVALVDDATIASLHERYLGDPVSTDVLSFDLRDPPEGASASDNTTIEGEIVVSVDTARRQASQLGIDWANEVLRYVIHGALHLRGFDDHTPTERTRMRRFEDRILAEVDRPLGTRRRRRPDHCKTNAIRRRDSGRV